MWSDFGKLRPQKKSICRTEQDTACTGRILLFLLTNLLIVAIIMQVVCASGFPEGVQLQEGDARFFEARCRYPAVYIGGNLT